MRACDGNPIPGRVCAILSLPLTFVILCFALEPSHTRFPLPHQTHTPHPKVVNLAMTPVNLLTILPYMRLGFWMFSLKGNPPSLAELTDGLHQDFGGTVRQFSANILAGMVA